MQNVEVRIRKQQNQDFGRIRGYAKLRAEDMQNIVFGANVERLWHGVLMKFRYLWTIVLRGIIISLSKRCYLVFSCAEIDRAKGALSVRGRVGRSRPQRCPRTMCVCLSVEAP